MPLEFWSDDIFKIIGDKLGSFVDADRSYEVSGRMTVAIIMVNLDSSEGLSAELNLVGITLTYRSWITRGSLSGATAVTRLVMFGGIVHSFSAGR